MLKIDINNSELKEFIEIFLKVPDNHTSRKQKYIRANNSNYITKDLRKEIRLRLPITNNEISAYVYYVKHNRKFWKTVNPLFSEKSYSKKYISLINKDDLITKNEDLSKTFNNFLVVL